MKTTIKNVVFDMGGVLAGGNLGRAIDRFREIGVAEPEHYLNQTVQNGIFGELEEGVISAEEFIKQLSELAGKDLNFQECQYAWLGYMDSVPEEGLKFVTELKQAGYRVAMLSNTNPFVASWARSNEFDGHGHPLPDYIEHLYLSFELKLTKPGKEIFKAMMSKEGFKPEETLFVDDSPYNIATAKALGLDTFQPSDIHTWPDQLRKIL